MFRNSSLTDTDDKDDFYPALDAPIVAPPVPARRVCRAELEEASPDPDDLPWVIRGTKGQIAYVVYRRPSGNQRTGKNYPIGPPDYETVAKKGKGLFIHHCGGNKERSIVVAWFGDAEQG
jgi:hypothetical protein